MLLPCELTLSCLETVCYGVLDPALERDMMNGHLLVCATLGKVIASASSDTESHSRLLQVSL